MIVRNKRLSAADFLDNNGSESESETEAEAEATIGSEPTRSEGNPDKNAATFMGVSDEESSGDEFAPETLQDSRFQLTEELLTTRGSGKRKGGTADAFALSDDENEAEEAEEAENSEKFQMNGIGTSNLDSSSEYAENDGNHKRKKQKKTPLTEEEAEKLRKKIKRTGVIYISRIPPYMKPAKLRQILSRFGEVDRVYLTPEDPKVYARRVKSGGNKKKCFTDGWAEYKRKKDAKTAAETLNGNIIGGKKGSYYYDDVMNVKYLPKFKWHNLTEQIAYETQARQHKLRVELEQAQRENSAFVKNVERSKMISKIQEKKKKKNQGAGGEGEGEVEVRRTFEQRKVASARSDAPEQLKVPLNSEMANVLDKVF